MGIEVGFLEEILESYVEAGKSASVEEKFFVLINIVLKKNWLTGKTFSTKYSSRVVKETGEWPELKDETGRINEEYSNDFLAEFIEEDLLKGGQLEWIENQVKFSSGKKIQDIERMVLHRLEIFSQRISRPNVIDNVLSMIDKHVIGEEVDGVSNWVYGKKNTGRLTDPELCTIANRVATIPRYFKSKIDEKREVTPYSQKRIKEVVTCAQKEARGLLGDPKYLVTELEMMAILEKVLTIHLPTTLDTYMEEGEAEDTAHASAAISTEIYKNWQRENQIMLLSPETKKREAYEKAKGHMNTLDCEETVVIKMKLVRKSDSDVADRLGKSRPTAASLWKNQQSRIAELFLDEESEDDKTLLAKMLEKAVDDRMEECENHDNS